MFGTRLNYLVAGRDNDATTRTFTNDNKCIALTCYTLPERGERKIFTHHHLVSSKQVKGVLRCKFDSNGLATSFALGCARSIAASQKVEGTAVELLFRHLS